MRAALRSVARRHQALDRDLAALDGLLGPLVAAAAPGLVAVKGVGTDTAGALLTAAGDNPERLRGEGAFARLCGVAPLPASSGKTVRHRLDRGGNRAANRALYLLVIRRLRWHAPTRASVARRTARGRTLPEIVRCLKRYVARELYPLPVPTGLAPRRGRLTPPPGAPTLRPSPPSFPDGPCRPQAAARHATARPRPNATFQRSAAAVCPTSQGLDVYRSIATR